MDYYFGIHISQQHVWTIIMRHTALVYDIPFSGLQRIALQNICYAEIVSSLVNFCRKENKLYLHTKII